LKKGIFDWIIDSLAYFSAVILASTVIVECYDIIMRYIFKSPLTWSNEICEYILFATGLLGAPWLLKVGGHINVELFTERMKEESNIAFKLISLGLGVLTCFALAVFALITTWTSYTENVMITKMLFLPKFYFIFIIFLGYLGLAFEFTRQFSTNLKRLRLLKGGS
jgi:TRAP-type C4-dicarboxylate transport system permease small subunit